MTVDQERADWDAKGATLRRARRAIWDNDEPSEQDRIGLLLDLIAPALGPVLKPGNRILDLGCGVGDMTRAMARRFPDTRFAGVDVSPVMLEHARKLGGDGIRWLQGDGRSLPRVGRLDGAWSVLMFQHIPPAAQHGYVREVLGRLTSGGIFRFQFVEGDWEPAGDVHGTDVARWCTEAGCTVQVGYEGIYDSWGWATAVKP